MMCNYFSMIIFLLALLALVLLFLVYTIRKVHRFKTTVHRETTEVEEVLHNSFTALHFEVSQCIEKLEASRRTRKLTKSEDAIIKSLSKSLDEAEKVIGKEIRDIKDSK